MFITYILVGITMQAQQAILTQLILYHCNKEIKHAYLDSLEKTGGILLEKVREAQQKNCPLTVCGGLFKKKKQYSITGIPICL